MAAKVRLLIYVLYYFIIETIIIFESLIVSEYLELEKENRDEKKYFGTYLHSLFGFRFIM